MSVRNAILGLLAQKPRHGYELYTAFEAVVGGDRTWAIKPAQVYTTLNRLEEAGLVRQQANGGAGVNIYRITPQGRAALRDWFGRGVAQEHQRDEFFVKLMVALASGEADPARLLQTQRAALYQELHAATALRDRCDPRREMAQILLLDKAIMHLEADLRWLDITESRLEDVKGQPLPQPKRRGRGRPKKKAA